MFNTTLENSKKQFAKESKATVCPTCRGLKYMDKMGTNICSKCCGRGAYMNNMKCYQCWGKGNIPYVKREICGQCMGSGVINIFFYFKIYFT